MAKLQEIIDKQVDDIIEHKSENLIIENRAHQRDKITLPEKLTQVQNLRHIFLAGVYLSNPEILLRLQTVKSISFYEVAGVINSIEVFGGIDGLTRLDLELDDELIQIPDNWKNLKKLKDLRLGYSDFEKFPEVIGQLSSLGSFSYDSGIYIDDKAIATLAKLPLLKKLAFTKMVPPGDLPIDSEKEYSFIFPESLGQLECLEELDLSTNVEMSALPESIKYLKNLKKLTLSNDDSDVWTIQLDSIPTTIGELTNLEELKLFGLVNLSRLPESIINLNKLRVLDIRETDIQHINLTHYQLTRLEWLGVNYPFAPLTQCHSLKELNYLLGDAFLFRGKFYKTSAKKPFDRKDLEPLTNLSSLEKLYIHGGILTGTHFLTELTHLEELGLSSNFSFLPANIDKLQKLRRLNIWGATALTSLPETLALIPALKYIRCASCGIKEPPAWLKDRPDIKFEIE